MVEIVYKVKLTTGVDTKDICLPNTIEELKNFALLVMHGEVADSYNFFYYDEDNDMITVEKSEDLAGLKAEAQKNPNLLLIVAKDPYSAEMIFTLVKNPPPDKQLPKYPEQKEEAKGQQQEDLPSYNCNETAFDNKEGVCPACHGSGKMSSDWRKEINSMIQNNITKMFHGEITKQASEMLKSARFEDHVRASQLSSMEFKGFICISCKEQTESSDRYTCVLCSDFNICEKCEINNSHIHPLLKFKNPHKTVKNIPNPEDNIKQRTADQPTNIPEGPTEEIKGHLPDYLVPSVDPRNNLPPLSGRNAKIKIIGVKEKSNIFLPVQEQVVSPSIEEVKEPKECKIKILDEVISKRDLRTSDEFQVNWKFLNEEKSDKPQNFEFVPIGENTMQADISKISIRNLGDEIYVEAKLVAPSNSGTFHQLFELRIEGKAESLKVDTKIEVYDISMVCQEATSVLKQTEGEKLLKKKKDRKELKGLIN